MGFPVKCLYLSTSSVVPPYLLMRLFRYKSNGAHCSVSEHRSRKKPCSYPNSKLTTSKPTITDAACMGDHVAFSWSRFGYFGRKLSRALYIQTSTKISPYCIHTET